MSNLRIYSEEVIQKTKDLAVLGLVPVQIVERLDLQGDERRNFLRDICTAKHPLHLAWRESYKHHTDDVDASLTALALSGDPDGLFLIYKVQQEKKLDQIKADLFGI